MIKVGILALTRRDGTFAEVGLRSWEESGGAALEAALLAADRGVYTLYRPLVVRPDRGEIERVLRDWCDVPNPEARCDLILTVGGEGFSARDVVPEATEAVIERAAPGLTGLLRHPGLDQSDLQRALSRGAAGLRRQTLIVNLPGEPDMLASTLNTLLPLLPILVQAAQSP